MTRRYWRRLLVTLALMAVAVHGDDWWNRVVTMGVLCAILDAVWREDVRGH